MEVKVRWMDYVEGEAEIAMVEKVFPFEQVETQATFVLPGVVASVE